MELSKLFSKHAPSKSTSPRSLHDLKEDINNVFNDLFNFSGSNTSSSLFENEPKLSINETDKNFTIIAELPGVKKEDIDIRLTDNYLTIKAEKKNERKEDEGDWHLSEISYGKIQRGINVPSYIEPDKSDINFNNGVLTINFAKSEDSDTKYKKLKIK